MILDNIQKDLFKKIAEKHNVPIKVVERIYASPFKLIKEVVPKLELHGVTDLDELEDIKCNFNIPGFCKYYLNKRKVVAVNNKINNLNKNKDE